MKPYRNLAETRTPDGTLFSLHEHDGRIYLKNDRRELMSTSLTYSEQLLADVGCTFLKGKRPKHPRVFIGGLGLGFTLKRILEIIGRPATVEVAELVPEIIEWNRTFLAEHNGPLLEDERTVIHLADAFNRLNKARKSSFDAILLDIDDTPESLITPQNSRLYTPAFLQTIRRALTPTGTVTFWLAEPTPRFLKTLRAAKFRVEEIPAKQHEHSKRARHCLYVCHKT
ncbi:MAG: spermine synthase [Verrucomicrobiales bacterium]|nr:spermine synthase [Verrucomicrobiales bacterium]